MDKGAGGEVRRFARGHSLDANLKRTQPAMSSSLPMTPVCARQTPAFQADMDGLLLLIIAGANTCDRCMCVSWGGGLRNLGDILEVQERMERGLDGVSAGVTMTTSNGHHAH